VLALLLSVLLQSVTGLFASDGIDTDGPFSGSVSGYTVKLMTRLHNWKASPRRRSRRTPPTDPETEPRF